MKRRRNIIGDAANKAKVSQKVYKSNLVEKSKKNKQLIDGGIDA